MLVDLVGIYSTLGGQKRAQSPIHWSMFRPNPALRLLYSNQSAGYRGMDSEKPLEVRRRHSARDLSGRA